MRFIKSATATLILKGVAMAAGLAVSVIIARVLGPEGRGVYALVMTVIVLATSFGVFGLTASNTYFIAGDARRGRAVGVQSLIVGLMGALLSAGVLKLVIYFSPGVLRGINNEILWLTVALIPLFLWGNLFAFAYLGQGKILAFNYFETGQRVIFVLAALITLLAFGGSFNFFLSVVLGSVALLVILYVAGYFAGTPDGPFINKRLLTPSITFGMKSYVATLLTLAVMRSGVLFVNHFGGNANAGLFAVAQQISEMVIIVPSIVGTVLFGRVAKGDSYELTPKVVRTIAAALLPVVLILFFGGEFIIKSIFGTQFVASALAMKLMLPGAYLLGLQVVLVNDIAGRGYPWPAALIWLPTFALNIIGYVLFIPVWGINGAAISVSLSFVVVFLFVTMYYARISGNEVKRLFVVSKSDITTIRSMVKRSLTSCIDESTKSKENEVTCNIDKGKTEAQGVGG